MPMPCQILQMRVRKTDAFMLRSKDLFKEIRNLRLYHGNLADSS